LVNHARVRALAVAIAAKPAVEFVFDGASCHEASVALDPRGGQIVWWRPLSSFREDALAHAPGDL
jgi:hypothetical protein